MTRSTTSNELKPGCAVLFFGVFFLAGSTFFVLLVWKLVIPEWRANHDFVEHTCKILDKRIVAHADEDGPTYRAEFLIEYTVNGRDYQVWTYEAAHISSSGRAGKEEILERFVVGQQYPCWYDPDDPNRAVLVLGYSWFLYVFLLIPLVFIAGGAGGMYYSWVRRGKSPELLAALASGRAGGDSSELADPFPTVPKIKLSNHPGTRLAYRLPVSTLQNWWSVGCLFAVILFWNGITSIFAALAVEGYLKGQPDICLTLFLVPFVAIGVALVAFLFRAILVTALCRPATVEIDAHPLTPSETCRLYIAQRGPLRLRGVKAIVVCEEVASHTKGEDTHTDRHRIHEADLGWEDDTLERQGDIQIPARAMHSFKATKNEIQWKIIISGKTGRWLSILWEYPFVVRPPSVARRFQ